MRAPGHRRPIPCSSSRQRRRSASGCSPEARSARDGGGNGFGPESERLVGGHHAQRVLRESEDVEPTPHGEMRLVARVHAHAVEIGTARGAIQTAQRPQMHLAGHGKRHEVGHGAAAGQHAPCARREPDEVAQPPGDLLLDERADRSRVPDVDPLLEPLTEHLTADRHRERRRREVAERGRVLRVEGHRRDAVPERAKHLVGGHAAPGHARGRSVGAKESPPRIRVAVGMDRPVHRAVEEPVERLGRDRVGEPRKRLPGARAPSDPTAPGRGPAADRRAARGEATRERP